MKQDVETAVAAYATALERVAAGSISAESLLQALIARDHLARVFSRGEVTRVELQSALLLDAGLQRDARAIVRRLGHQSLHRWRETRQPPAESWWWWLDLRGEENEMLDFSWWLVPVLLFMTIGITVVLEIIFRLLGVGADIVSLCGITSQFLLAVLAGSTLTQQGRRYLRRALLMVGLGEPFHVPIIVLLATVFLAGTCFLRMNLSWGAAWYSRRGELAESRGLLNSAIGDYERALKLDSGFAEAHYNLAFALESVHDDDRAVSEYQQAIQQSDDFYAAYNNLARLLILQRKDLSGALGLLEAALRKQPKEPLVRYSLFKNRGWANLGLGLPVRAEEDLRQALKLRPEGAAAHCLLAQTLEVRANHAGALKEWEDCLAYLGGQEAQVEPAWIAIAKERIEEGL